MEARRRRSTNAVWAIVAIAGRGVQSDFSRRTSKTFVFRWKNIAHRRKIVGEIVGRNKGASCDFSEKNGAFLEKIRSFGGKKKFALL
jgi:hypothetical protein